MIDSKSFTFKVAQEKEKENSQKSKQWKAREGVALAGCTLTQFWWGREPTFDLSAGVEFSDGSLFC